MNITLEIVYDNDGNWIIREPDSCEEMTYGDLESQVATVTLSVQLPEIKIPVVTVKVPELSTTGDISATVTIE